MPIYEYECLSCNTRSEVMQRFSDPPPESCTDCGGELRKLISAPAFQFKGDGWYVTDYARKDKDKDKDGGKTNGSGEKTAKASESKSSDSGKSDSKPSPKEAPSKAERTQAT